MSIVEERQHDPAKIIPKDILSKDAFFEKSTLYTNRKTDIDKVKAYVEEYFPRLYVKAEKHMILHKITIWSNSRYQVENDSGYHFKQRHKNLESELDGLEDKLR